ncbi:DUF421 domain-containing protein [Pedobacter immunditicola]|uniref:DUF421 domain-containing protein n=1 Tax=Pedobacter immunditicola TaxID=3133440 RepID=UPI0030B04520
MEVDWHRILFNDEPYSFFLEILFRTPLMFLAVVIILRFTGKRGVQQLSIFEMVMIITLGSAAGDSMFYKDVGLFHAVAVFVIILGIYRLIIMLITKYEKVELLLEGKPMYIIKHGKLSLKSVNGQNLGSDEFFGELRSHNIEHLGQIRYAILEDTGRISVFYFPDDEVLPGLPILPDDYNKKQQQITKPGLYACAKCGSIYPMEITDLVVCENCEHNEWVEALDRRRIT